MRKFFKSGTSTWSKVSEIIVTVLLILTAAFTAYVMINTARGNVVSIFGRYILNVVTGSMEPTIATGEYIIVVKTDPSTLQVNDIISFYSDSNETKDLLITHRIIEIKEDGSFVTKGDANNIEDEVTAKPDRVLGKYDGKARFFGMIGSFTDRRKLLLTLVIIPVFIMSIFEVRSLGRTWKKLKKEDKDVELDHIEEIKRKAVEDYLKEKNKEEQKEEQKDENKDEQEE